MYYYFESGISPFSKTNEFMYIMVRYRYHLFAFKIIMSIVYNILMNLSKLVELFNVVARMFFLESEVNHN